MRIRKGIGWDESKEGEEVRGGRMRMREDEDEEWKRGEKTQSARKTTTAELGSDSSGGVLCSGHSTQ